MTSPLAASNPWGKVNVTVKYCPFCNSYSCASTPLTLSTKSDNASGVEPLFRTETDRVTLLVKGPSGSSSREGKTITAGWAIAQTGTAIRGILLEEVLTLTSPNTFPAPKGGTNFTV